MWVNASLGALLELFTALPGTKRVVDKSTKLLSKGDKIILFKKVVDLRLHYKMKLQTLTLLVVLLLHKVRSQQISDMGDCACVCGLQSNAGGVISPNGVSPVSIFDNLFRAC